MTIWQHWPQILLASTLFVGTQALADQDLDGVPDNADNCLLAANASQLDSNGDGYGNACDPDLDNNGVVNFLDLQQMRDAFFTNPASPDWNPDADMDGSNLINFIDLGVMRDLFFGPPGPVGLVQWINPESGNWNEPTNWFPVGVPVAPNFVRIDTPGIVVTHDSGDNACSGILSQADIALSDASRLSVFGDMDMQGSLIMTDNNTTLANARVIRTVVSEGAEPLIFENNVIFENITLGIDLTIPNSFVVKFENGLTLDNTSLTMVSTGSFTQAQFNGTQTVGGTGEILFSGTTANQTLIRLYENVVGEVLTIGPGITVRTLTTGGWLGTNTAGRGLAMLGDVVADVANKEITVQGDLLTIDGSLTISNDAIIAVDGEWTASNATTMTAASGGELELHGNWSSEATVSVTDGLLDIGNNNSTDTWVNLGSITLANSDAQLGGVFAPSDIGSMTSSGITFLDGRIVLTGLTFDIDAAPGTWQLDANGVIQDGTVTGTLLEVVGNGDFDGTTLNVDTYINNSRTIDVFNGLTLDNASLTLFSSGSFTQMLFQGTQTLGGTGEVLYDGTTANQTLIRVFENVSGETLTVGSGITARTLNTGGWLGSNGIGRGLTMLGAVVADVSGKTITVQGEQLTIDASLDASDGSIITVNGEWTASSDTNMTATNGAELKLFGNWSSEATVNVTDGLLDIGNNNNSDTWTNLGTITLVNSDAELGGIFVPSDIGTTAIDGIALLNGRLILTGLVFDIDAAPGTWQLGTNGIIQDGTVTGTLLEVVGNGDFDGTTLAADTVINNSWTIDVFNGLTLDDSSLTMISNGSFTQMLFQGTQSLGGTGEVLYGGTATNDSLIRLYENLGGEVLTIGSGITVRTLTTGGWLGNSSAGRGLTMLGDVVANTAGAVVTVQGDLLSIDGSLTGSGGAGIALDGNWSASAATTIDMSGGGTLSLFGSWSSEATVTVADSSLDIGNTTTEGWTNLGSIDLSNTDATFGGAFVQSDLGSFTSDGTVTIDGSLDNTAQTLNVDTLPGTWQLGVGTISGGTISGTSFDVIGSGGTLDGVELSADMNVTNGTTMKLTGGLTLSSSTVTLISNGSFTQVQANGSQTVGGTGMVRFSGSATNDSLNRFYANVSGDTLTIGSGITFITDTVGGWLGNTSTGRGLALAGTVASNLSGHKISILGDPITISGDATASADADLQIGGDWNATGSATISMAGGGELELFGQWVNSGGITVTNSLLDIGNNVTDHVWTNLGTIDLVNSDAQLGGLFVFDDLGVFTSDALVTVNGDLDNTDLTLDLDTVPGTWELGTGGTIIGGTVTGTSFEINGSGDLDGVTLAVDTTLGNSSTSVVTNGLTLDNASVTLASSGGFSIMNFSGTQTLGGTGEILFGGTTTGDSLNRIVPTDSGDTLTIGPNITVRPTTTGGLVGTTSTARAVTLQGSVVSDMAGEVVTINGHPFSNNGSIIIDAGSVIAGSTEYVQGAGGSLEIEISGTLDSEFGRLALTSSTALNGTLDIVLSGFSPSLGNTFEIVSAASRSGTFSTVTGTDAGSGNTFVPIYNADNVTLDVQ